MPANAQPPFEFSEPTDMVEALALAALPGAKLFSGGCDIVGAMRRGDGGFDRLVSIARIEGLDGFSAYPKTGLEFGARVLIRRLCADIWVSKRWAALHEAMAQIRPPQIANMGTVVGNVCAARADYDLALALVAHRAALRIDDGRRQREQPVETFYIGPGRTVLEPGEMVTSVFAPPPAADAGSAFRKIAARDGTLKIAMSAYLALDAEKEAIVEAVFAVGGLGLMPQRLTAVETVLTGVPAQTDSYEQAAEQALAAWAEPLAAAPQTAVATQWARVLARDVLEQAASRARSRHDPAEDAHLAY